MKTESSVENRSQNISAVELKRIFDASQAKLVADFSFGYSMVNITAMQLMMVREQFAYRARAISQDLLEAAARLEKSGWTPNSCGVAQSTPMLESYNGQIASLTSTLNSLLSEYPV